MFSFTGERGSVAVFFVLFSLGKGVRLLSVCFLTGERDGVAMCVFVSLGKGVGLLCVCFFFTGERGWVAKRMAVASIVRKSNIANGS